MASELEHLTKTEVYKYINLLIETPKEKIKVIFLLFVRFTVALLV